MEIYINFNLILLKSKLNKYFNETKSKKFYFK